MDKAFERLARLGYAARGTVYVVVGGLAVLAGLGRGRASPDSHGALTTVLSQPFGSALLGLIALGLICFALWRLAQGALDADHLGRSAKGLVRRAGLLASACVNAGLAASSISLLIGNAGSRSGDSSARDWTAYIFDLPLGEWVVGLGGACVVATGLGTGLKGLKGSFMDRLSSDAKSQDWVVWIGRAGYVARALVFVLAGGFLIMAAVHASAREARGLAGTLRVIQDQPYGSVLFLITAAGLFAFGVFQLVTARYRRINAPEMPKAGLGLR